MDRPLLYSLVERLRAEERLAQFAAALPTRARVSEPALPLLLAALHEELGRALVVLLPEDADARDAADAASWFVGEERVALLPGRGVHWGSGLEPPPHLVGERARALDVLTRGGLVCASAAALAEGLPPPEERPAPLRLAPGDEPGIEGLSEALALAGYDRVDRVEERGQFAVRGGLVDVFPATGREPLRVELFGDEIEQIRAFSPFTQRALRQVDDATVYPAAERRRDLVEVALRDDGEAAPPSVEVPADLVPAFDRVPDLVWQPDEVRQVWREEGFDEPAVEGAAELSPLPQEGMLRRVTAEVLEPGGKLNGLRFAVAPARRGFVWRDIGLALLPDTQVFRKRPPRATAPVGRALQSFSDLRTRDYVVHEDHGIAQLLGFETREVAGVTRDYLLLGFRGEDRVFVPHEQIGKVSRYVGADSKAPALSKLGGKAWDNLKSRAREHLRELAGDLLQLYAQRQTRPGVAHEVEHEWVEKLEAEFPYREPNTNSDAPSTVPLWLASNTRMPSF